MVISIKQNLVTLPTERLLLRPLHSSDLESVHLYASAPENTAYMSYFPKTKAETARFLENITREWEKPAPDFFEFAVLLEGTLIGAVSVYLREQGTAGELGWILNKRYWGHGYAAEAALALKAFAVSQLGLRRLMAHCDGRNTASRAVMEKLGMTLEDDTKTRRYPKTGEIAQDLLFSLSLPRDGR